MARLRLEPVRFVEAIRAASAARVVLPEVYYGLLPASARAVAFTVSGLAGLDQIRAVLDSLRRVMNEGGTFQAWRRDILASGDDLTLPAYRLETIYRTNLQGWWNRGRAEQILDNLDTHPYLLYSAVNDSRTRPDHAEMHGTLLPANDPWWQTHYPPNGYNCRCRAIALTEREAMRRGITQTPPPAEPDQGWAHSALQRGGELAGLRAAVANATQTAERMAKDRETAPFARAALAMAANMLARLADPEAHSARLPELIGQDAYTRARSAVEKAAKARGVPIDAAVALYAYTGTAAYRAANRIMRYTGGAPVSIEGIRDPDRYLPLVGGVKLAIASLPKSPGLAFRGLDPERLPPDFLRRHTAGALVRYNAPTSATVANRLAFGGAVHLVIRHRSGVQVREFSAWPNDEQVMLPPGALFRVVRRRNLGGGQVRIWLDEMDPRGLPRREVVHEF